MGLEPPALKFFNALWPAGIPAGHRLLLWSVTSKVSAWFDDIGKAADYLARDRNQQSDTYFGTGVVSAETAQKAGTRSRGEARQRTAIPGLWIDLDVGTEGHKGKQLPPSLDEALALLDEAQFGPPNVIVHTGHGVHAWYLFDEPWMFKNNADRTKAAVLVQRFQNAVQNRAQAHGWTLDSTHDLARLLRAPGTVNHKDVAGGGEPLPVWADFSDDAPRHTRAVWERMVQLAAPARPAAAAPVNLDGADPNKLSPRMADLIEKLCDQDKTFESTWKRSRVDLTDPSASGYDLAIADYLAPLANDEEIASALVEWRRIHGEGTGKIIDRMEDYVSGTLRKARALGVTLPSAEADDDGEGLRNRLAAVGVNFVGLTKHSSPNEVSWWITVLASGVQREFKLSDDWHMSFRSFRKSLVNGASAPPTRILKDAQWIELANAMVLSAREQTEEHVMAEQLEDYLQNQSPSSGPESALVENSWWEKDGKVFIWEHKFRAWIKIQIGDRVKKTDTVAVLKHLGWERIQEGRRHAYWRERP